MARTVFLVDGFNLYHGIVEASRDAGGKTTKWLDLRALCECYLPLVGQVAGSHAFLERIYYFSAIPNHRPVGTRQRHALYMRCLRTSGIDVELARFKRKDVVCPACHARSVRHEEKETDVAVAVRLFETCLTDEADAVVLLTGDTDLAPAVRTCKRLFPQKAIFFAFPYKRSNAELEALAPESVSMKLRTVLGHQFPDPLTLADGTSIPKPPEW